MKTSAAKLIVKILLGVLLTTVSNTRAGAAFKNIHDGDSDKIIIFVHGLWGNLEQSFSSSSNNKSWPEMFSTDSRTMRAGPPLSSYSIGILGYPASRKDKLRIEEITNRLTIDLIDEGIFDDFREVYFVAHSLGGIITKKIFMKMSIDNSKYAKSIKAIFLISTPSQGVPAANFLNILPKFLSGQLVADLTTIDTNSYLNALENDWQAYLRKRIDGFPRILCAYETRSTATMIIVPQTYTATHCDEEPRAENEDHISIVKPKTQRDSIYRWVRGRIANVQNLLSKSNAILKQQKSVKLTKICQSNITKCIQRSRTVSIDKLQHCNQAYECSPSNIKIILEIGKIHQSNRDYDKAIKAYENVLILAAQQEELKPEAEVHYQLGKIAFKKKLLEKAKVHHIKSLKIATMINDVPGKSYNYVALGIIALKNGQRNEASKNLKLGLKLAYDLRINANIFQASVSLARIAYMARDKSAECKYLRDADDALRESGQIKLLEKSQRHIRRRRC